MSSHWLAERQYTLIEAAIKSGIATALAAIRTDRADAYVSTESPHTQSYFKYASAKAYRCPAVFIIPQSIDLQNAARGANHINAEAKVAVSVVVEDRDLNHLVVKSWRYQAALHKVLHESSLTSGDGKVRLFIKVERITFSPEFSDEKDPHQGAGVFRKEVLLECNVDHIENL